MGRRRAYPKIPLFMQKGISGLANKQNKVATITFLKMFVRSQKSWWLILPTSHSLSYFAEGCFLDDVFNINTKSVFIKDVNFWAILITYKNKIHL